jgi:hypothetical protein
MLLFSLAGSIILDVTYGYKTQGSQDPLIQLAEELMNDFLEVQ